MKKIILEPDWQFFPPLKDCKDELIFPKEALNWQVKLDSIEIDKDNKKITCTLFIGTKILPDLKDGDYFFFFYNKNDLCELMLQKPFSSISLYEGSQYLLCDEQHGKLIFYLPYDIYLPYLCEIYEIEFDEFPVILLPPPEFHYEIITNYQIHLFLNGISASRKYQFDCFKDHGVLRNY